MKHIAQFMDKYEDLTETLNGILVMTVTALSILGLAPLVIFLQVSTF
jgi:hypothetical protein